MGRAASGSAPRKIRSTLYCWLVMSNGAQTISNEALTLSAADSKVA